MFRASSKKEINILNQRIHSLKIEIGKIQGQRDEISRLRGQVRALVDSATPVTLEVSMAKINTQIVSQRGKLMVKRDHYERLSARYQVEKSSVDAQVRSLQIANNRLDERLTQEIARNQNNESEELKKLDRNWEENIRGLNQRYHEGLNRFY